MTLWMLGDHQIELFPPYYYNLETVSEASKATHPMDLEGLWTLTTRIRCTTIVW